MKTAVRFEGTIHETIECPEMGDRFDIVVIGAEFSEPDDTISVRASGRYVDLGLRLARDQARRLGELLIQAADDVAPPEGRF